MVTRPLWLALLLSPTNRMVYKVMEVAWYRQYPPHKINTVEYTTGLKESYRLHNKEVKAIVPPNQLLVFNVRQDSRRRTSKSRTLINSIRPGLLEGAWEVPPACNSKTIHGIEMKFG